MNKFTNNEAGIEGDWDMNDTLVYNTKMYNHLNNLRHNKLDSPETYKAMKQYKYTLDNIDKTKNYCCSRIQNKGMNDARYKYCNYKAETKEELMAHERTCFNIIETEVKDNRPYLECDICKCTRFYDKGKYKALYALNKHKKNCRLNIKRKRIRYITDFLAKADKDNVNEIFNIIMAKQKKQENPNIELTHENISKNISQTYESDNESDRPVSAVSAVSAVSTSSEMSDWNFDNIYYLVDSKNRVYDEYDNHIGQRVKDEFSGEFKLELE